MARGDGGLRRLLAPPLMHCRCDCTSCPPAATTVFCRRHCYNCFLPSTLPSTTPPSRLPPVFPVQRLYKPWLNIYTHIYIILVAKSPLGYTLSSFAASVRPATPLSEPALRVKLVAAAAAAGGAPASSSSPAAAAAIDAAAAAAAEAERREAVERAARGAAEELRAAARKDQIARAELRRAAGLLERMREAEAARGRAAAALAM